MAALSTAQAIAWTDFIAAGTLAALGTTGTGMGIGTTAFGAGKAVADLTAAVIASADAQLIAASIAAMRSGADSVSVNGLAPTMWAALVRSMDELARTCTAITCSNLEDFCEYYNIGAGGDYACLLAPEFVQLYTTAGVGTLSQYCGFFAIKQGSVYANAIAKKVVGGAFTAGTNVDATLYAGGRGRIKWSGMTGTGAVTVTGTWRKLDGTLVTSKTGAYTISAAASGTEDLVPHSTDVGTGGLLVSVDDAGIAMAGTLASGTIYVETHEPTGRTYPPTV